MRSTARLSHPFDPPSGSGAADVGSSARNTDRAWSARMVAAQSGDRAAYEALLRDCIPFIRRVARAQGVYSDGIDDVVQETLLTIHGARQTYDPGRSFTGWLRIIAQRRAIDGLRRSGRTTAREVHAPLAYENHPDVGTSPEAAVLERDRTARLNSAIGALPAAQRKAIEHFVGREPPAATEAPPTEGSLRVSWHRAIKSLRAQISEKE
jgi:RNA polymerase sigma factor (sigma-70 family)